MARGGKRPGAGRPKGRKLQKTLEKEAAREYVRQVVTAHLRPLLKAQLANAQGIKYLVTRAKQGGKFIRVTEAMAKIKLGQDEEIIEVWEKDPSVHAFAELMTRAFGRPKEELTVTGAVTLEHLIAGSRRLRLNDGQDPSDA